MYKVFPYGSFICAGTNKAVKLSVLLVSLLGKQLLPALVTLNAVESSIGIEPVCISTVISQNKTKLSSKDPDSKISTYEILDLFATHAKSNPNALALQDIDGKKYQYRETLIRVLKISNIFINKGIKPKDRIAIISENRKEYLEIEMACAKIGAILVAINWRLSDNEINYCINLVKPKVVVLSNKYNSHKKLNSIKNKKILLLNSVFERKITNPMFIDIYLLCFYI